MYLLTTAPKPTCEGVDPSNTWLNPQPPIPGNSRTMQRVEGFWYKDLVAAWCKSHLIQKVSEYERARTKSHSTSAANTESRTNDDYMRNERARITTTVPIICPFIWYTRSHHSISQIQDFATLYKSQPLIQRRGPRPRAHWYMRKM